MGEKSFIDNVLQERGKSTNFAVTKKRKVMKSEPAIGTRMMISPYLTHRDEWLQGDLIEIEHNRYRGLVYVVKTDAGEIFFSVAADFKNC